MKLSPFLLWEYRSACVSWPQAVGSLGLFGLLYYLSTFAFPIFTDSQDALRIALLSALIVEIYEGGASWEAEQKSGFFDQIRLMGQKALFFWTVAKIGTLLLLNILPKTFFFLLLLPSKTEDWVYSVLFLTATAAAGILGQHVGFLLGRKKESNALRLLVLFPFLTPIIILSGLGLTAPNPESICLGLLGIFLLNSLLYIGSVLFLSVPIRYDESPPQ